MTHFSETGKDIVIDPDYTSISIPPNIAPLNFRVIENADRYKVRFHNKGSVDFILNSKDGFINIPQKKWKKLLTASGSREILIEVFVKKSSQWGKYNSISIFVMPDTIDKYLVYRLIEPGFETWSKMGIYQRNLENFDETPVMLNSISDGNCMNCHTFFRNSSSSMMFHMRGENAGTILYHKGSLSKINTKTEGTISAGVYPSWHPSGNYIAYSVNNIVQSFHAIPAKKIEVYDTLSNIIVYDINKNIVSSCQVLSDPERLETFPSWSPDGRYLYFCCAGKKPMNKYKEIRYDLLRIAFNPGNCSFGALDTVMSVSDKGKSISFPRISPDGRYLLFCISDYGNFSIWHSESDLHMLDMVTGVTSRPEINSDRTESYHSWSSSGKWIVFSSRRGDGLYTRPYFSYFDSSGRAHKPFILPQKDPGFYFDFLKSYNLPELVTSRVKLNPRKLADITKSLPLPAVFKSTD